MVSALEQASLQAAQGVAGDNTCSFEGAAYELLMRRGDVLVRRQNSGDPAQFLQRMLSCIQGRPTPLTLYQNVTGGFIGPYAKRRKAARARNRVKENAVLFIGKDTDAKRQDISHVFKISVGDRGLAREIRMMRILAKGPGFAPGILTHDFKLRWHITEFIDDNNILGAPGQADIYLEEIALPYFRFWGVRTVPLSHHLLKTGFDSARFHQLAESLALPAALVERLPTGGLTFSMTHGGGICEECRRSPDGRPFLLDWEKACLAPTGDDILQAFEHKPERAVRVMDDIRAPGDLSAPEQLAFALVCRHNANLRKRHPMPDKLRQDKRMAALLSDLAT